jgi:hypothetical protein
MFYMCVSNWSGQLVAKILSVVSRFNVLPHSQSFLYLQAIGVAKTQQTFENPATFSPCNKMAHTSDIVPKLANPGGRQHFESWLGYYTALMQVVF